MFQQVTGKAPPPTPISAKTYADQGLPFYKIYGEKSTIKGDFNGIKTVKELDKIKNANGKRKTEGDDALEPNKKAKDCSDGEDDNDTDEEEDSSGFDDDDDDDDELDPDDDGSNPVDNDGDEQPFQNPVILLNPNGSAMGTFTPVSELMEQLSRLKLRKSKAPPAKK